MTGKDLIIFILQNNLENVELFDNGKFIAFMTEEEAAAKFDVGVATIRVWYAIGALSGITIGDTVFFRKDAEDPRKEIK